MRTLLAFLLAFGLCSSHALPAQQSKAVAVDDDLSDIIKVVENLLEDGIDAAANDITDFINWVETEWVHIEPEVEKAEEAVAAVGKQVLSDIIELNHAVIEQVLLFVGKHAKQIHDIYDLVQDAMDKLGKGDNAGFQKDVSQIVDESQGVLKDLGDVLKTDAEQFLQWLGQKWTSLKPLLDSALAALETLGSDVVTDLAAEFQALLKNVATFFENHKTQFAELWQDILHVLKALGIPVHDVSDLTPAENDVETMVTILQSLAKDFETIAEADGQKLIDWAKAEYQKIQPNIQKDLEALKSFIDDVLEEADKLAKEEIDDAVAFYHAHEAEVNTIFQDVVQGVHALENGDTATAQKDFSAAFTAAKSLLGDLLVLLKKHVGEFLQWVVTEWSVVKAQLKVLFDQLKSLVQDLAQELQDGATLVANQIDQFLNDHQAQVQKLSDTFKQFLKDLGLAN